MAWGDLAQVGKCAGAAGHETQEVTATLCRLLQCLPTLSHTAFLLQGLFILLTALWQHLTIIKYYSVVTPLSLAAVLRALHNKMFIK